jgi:23S rRNA (uracil1939-C5)-methyltransferase
MTIEPFCKYYGACGGCQLQHVEPAQYARDKSAQVTIALRAVGIDWPELELIDAHGEGRRRMALHARAKEGLVTAGFMARRSHDLIDIDRCPIVVPSLARATDIALAIGKQLGDCDVWITAADNGLDVSVKAERRIAAMQLATLARVATEQKLLRLTANGDVIVAIARPMIDIDGVAVALPPGAFLQATQAGEETLARLVINGIGKTKHAADLYCGLGAFALRVAKVAVVAAWDDDKPAIAALQQAARHAAGRKPISASLRNLMREPLTEMELKPFDAVIFDPPRAGAEAQAKRLAKSSVPKVIAISCNPQTFARDAKILIDGGYRLTSLHAVDQFKWSTHVECVGVFRK